MRMMRHPWRGPVPTTPLADASASRKQQRCAFGEPSLGLRRLSFLQLAFDPTEHGRRNPRHVLVPGAGRRVEHGSLAAGKAVDAVENEGVKMRAEIEGGVEALNDRDGAGLEHPAQPEATGPTPQPRRDDGDELAQD